MKYGIAFTSTQGYSLIFTFETEWDWFYSNMGRFGFCLVGEKSKDIYFEMTDIACTVSNLLIVLLIVPELNMYVWLLLFGGGRCFCEKMFLTVKKTASVV